MSTDKLSPPLLKIDALHKRFKNIQAVHDLNLIVKPGEIFGLVGADGAGKSTILQMICGIEAPTSGTMVIDGYDVVDEPDAIRERIGYMSQDFSLYLDMSVEENIDYMACLRCLSPGVLKEEKERLLHFARMALFRNRKAGALSGGMKKKLALCCALIHRPKLLLLDEPTTAVDPVSRGELWRILYEFIMQGISVVIATPDMNEAERCHRIALLQHGKLIACDSPEKLKANIGKQVCTFNCNQASKARRIIARELGIEAQVYGDNLRLFLDNAEQEFAVITALLKKSEIEINTFTPTKPNMGDVYLSMLDDNEAEEIDLIVHDDALIIDQFQKNPVTSQLSETVVNVENISKHYGEFRAVDEISFSVSKGTVFGLLGPNGAGKTTLIKMMCGLVQPTSGQIFIAGYDVCQQRRLAKSNIGYMSQLFSLYPDLSVIQNLEFFASIYGLSRQKARSQINWAIDLAGLQNKKAYLARELPTGWRQKLALGAALMHEPKLLFLDEPTSGVDPIARAEFWDIIYDLSESGVTVIVTTHFMEEADRCNLIMLVNAGKLIGVGSPEQLKSTLPVQCYEIKTPALLKTYHGISSLDNVQQVSMFGETVHAITHNNKNELSLKMIRDAGIQINSIEKIRPTLEDVFLNKISNDQEALG